MKSLSIESHYLIVFLFGPVRMTWDSLARLAWRPRFLCDFDQRFYRRAR